MNPNVYLRIGLGGHGGSRGFEPSLLASTGWPQKLADVLPAIRSFRPDGVIVCLPYGERPGDYRMDALKGLREDAKKDKALAKMVSGPERLAFLCGIRDELSRQGVADPRSMVYMGAQLTWKDLTLTQVQAALRESHEALPPDLCWPIYDTLGHMPAPMSTAIINATIARYGRCGYEPRPSPAAMMGELKHPPEKLVGYSSGAYWWSNRDRHQDYNVPLDRVPHRQIIQTEQDDEARKLGVVGAYDSKEFVLLALRDDRDVALEWHRCKEYALTAAALKAEASA